MPGTGNSIQVSQMSGRDPVTLTVIYFLLGSALGGSWNLEQSLDLNSGTPIWDAGILIQVLITRPNTHLLNHFEVDSLVASTAFTMLCNHHHYFQKFHHPKQKLSALNNNSLLSMPLWTPVTSLVQFLIQ